jgi:hypothetical protein
VALVAHERDPVARQLQETFGWPDPFHDPGVGEFGLVNAVFAAGDTFVEVVAPVQTGTTAGRYLDRRGADSGYMAIFQVPDMAMARRRVAEAGVRVVWQVDLDDMAGTHLHPKDVPGAIVSLDWADPPEAWRWGGPAWIGGGASARPGGITSLTIEVKDPVGAVERWTSVLGVAPAIGEAGATIPLDSAGQVVRFVPADPARGEGIVEVGVTGWPDVDTTICGVRFVEERPR